MSINLPQRNCVYISTHKKHEDRFNPSQIWYYLVADFKLQFDHLNFFYSNYSVHNTNFFKQLLSVTLC